MSTRYRTFSTDAALAAAERALWVSYADAERAARGQAPGSSLDTRQGRPVAAVTVRYADPVVTAGTPGGVLPYDDAAQARFVAQAAGAVDADALPEPHRTTVRDRERPPAADATRTR